MPTVTPKPIFPAYSRPWANQEGGEFIPTAEQLRFTPDPIVAKRGVRGEHQFVLNGKKVTRERIEGPYLDFVDRTFSTRGVEKITILPSKIEIKCSARVWENSHIHIHAFAERLFAEAGRIGGR